MRDIKSIKGALEHIIRRNPGAINNPMVKDFEEMVTEIERLQAIVSKLPKTKDGVTGSPLMRVYFPPGYCEFDNDGIVHMCVSYEGGNTSITDAYSTKAAAKAAEETETITED